MRRGLFLFFAKNQGKAREKQAYGYREKRMLRKTLRWAVLLPGSRGGKISFANDCNPRPLKRHRPAQRVCPKSAEQAEPSAAPKGHTRNPALQNRRPAQRVCPKAQSKPSQAPGQKGTSNPGLRNHRLPRPMRSAQKRRVSRAKSRAKRGACATRPIKTQPGPLAAKAEPPQWFPGFAV